MRAGRVCGGDGGVTSPVHEVCARRKGVCVWGGGGFDGAASCAGGVIERIAAQIPAKGADATQSVAALVAFDPTLPAA